MFSFPGLVLFALVGWQLFLVPMELLPICLLCMVSLRTVRWWLLLAASLFVFRVVYRHSVMVYMDGRRRREIVNI